MSDQTGSANGGPTGTQALDRAALVISTVVRADEPMSFADVQEACDLPKSTCSRVLGALERTELLERNDDGDYVAGPLFWLYATRHDPWEELVRLARPTLVAIGEDTLETVHLAVARGDRVVHVAQIDSQFILGTRDWTDVDVPPHASALGKVLLAHGVLATPTSLDALTEHTLTDRSALNRQLQQAVTDGWASTLDELEIGLSGVAVPIRGSRGDVIAAIGISAPTARVEDRIDAIGHELAAHAGRLSRQLSRKNTQREGVA